jgi:mono/diheme cytochrome c family protein
VTYKASCVNCHGGLGEGGFFPEIEPTITTYTKYQGQPIAPLTLQAYIAKYMPLGAPLNAQNAANVAEYIKTLPGSDAGKAAYNARGCAGCHGANGAGPLPLLKAGFIDRYATVDLLSTKIRLSMPPTAPGSCDKVCADNIAKYIWTNF